jgi:hypothetical protein
VALSLSSWLYIYYEESSGQWRPLHHTVTLLSLVYNWRTS